MEIRSLFQEDINRKINGVVKVDQDASDVLVQELEEYVITRDLKKHFRTFFNEYEESFREPTSDIGVWISGFFGSGKSHFLKMLSYLLSNEEVQGVRTVERFRKKFEDDPLTYSKIETVSKGQTDTILFNIDIEAIGPKDGQSILRVFTKMFYNYLGYYGEDPKVAKLEQYIERRGKKDEFYKVFEEKNGEPWLEARDAYAFFEDDVVETLVEVLSMSTESARNWYNSSETSDGSIARFVSEIKDYIDSKPEDFRLVFLVDEVGQFVGGNEGLLLNLQSLVEKIGSECEGKVWVVCTGQEAIDEIIKTREDEFSRIQARFKTRLSLTSSSVDEVIQKRILKKKAEVKPELEDIYNSNESVLRNLFSFSNAIQDIKGYTDEQEFVDNYPFIPYQFIVMQKVFGEIRKHGNSGKHLSGGERSMLSGFQEAAQKIQHQDVHTLAPFYLFYDTVHTFLDSSIRNVIDRCQNAADKRNGIEQEDVDLLKLLYLIRYVDDIPANLDNLVILMADRINLDKVTMRESVRNSLSRLLSQNYIARNGDVYNFLTDEEQDIQREIYRNTQVDTSSVVARIRDMIFTDIYTTRKFRYGKYDFPFDQIVDDNYFNGSTNAMKLHILTMATDPVDKHPMQLMVKSKGQAIIVLADTPYYESLEKALQIQKYVSQRNVSQLPESVQAIIRSQQEQARRYETSARENLEKAIVEANFYVDGVEIDISGDNAKTKLDQALEALVAHVYSELNLIEKNAETDADIIAVLTGDHLNGVIPGMEYNRDAALKMEEYLELQDVKNMVTSMADIQSRYQGIPYGWREIDIALVAAMLIYDQKVTVKYGGETIYPDNPKLPDMLRKKSEIASTRITKRHAISVSKIRRAKELVREYFNTMDVPNDEDGLVQDIIEKFSNQKSYYQSLISKYTGEMYPGKKVVSKGIKLIESVLSQQKDNIALIDALLEEEQGLLDNREDMQAVEGFFKNQVQIFDSAVGMVNNYHNDLEYLKGDKDVYQAYEEIRRIVIEEGTQDTVYKNIPELNVLMDIVREGHDQLLETKRSEIHKIIEQCQEEIHRLASDNYKSGCISVEMDRYFADQKNNVEELEGLLLLDGVALRVVSQKDIAAKKIIAIISEDNSNTEQEVLKDGEFVQQVIKKLDRQIVFPSKILVDQADIDSYVEDIRAYLMSAIKNADGIEVE